MLLLAIVVGGCQAGNSRGEPDCLPATITVSPDVLEPGQDFVLTGEGFVCNDAFYNGEPAGDLEEGGAAEVVWEQGGETISIGEVEIDNRGMFEATLVAPGDATVGGVKLVVGRASVDVTIE